MFLEIISIPAKCQMWLNALHTQQVDVEVTKTTSGDSDSDSNIDTGHIEDIRIEFTFVWTADIIDLKLGQREI